MAISAKPGFLIDPSNPNGVIRDPNVGTLPGGAPDVPVVTPPTGSSLQGTMTTPQAAPTNAPAPSGQPTSTPTSQNTTNAGYNPAWAPYLSQDAWNTLANPNLTASQYQDIVKGVNGNIQNNNQLVTQKNAVVNAMLGGTVDPAILASLPPDIQHVIQSGDRGGLLIQAQILNGQIQGYNNDVASSLQTLTTGYAQQQQQAEIQKKDALNTLMTIAQNFVDPKTGAIDTSKMQSALSSLYPGVDLSGVVSQLQGLTTPSVYNSTLHYAPTTTGDLTVNIPTGTIASQTNNPLNIKFSTTTSGYGGQDSGIKGQDGGTFASFDSPQAGLQAAVSLLQSPVYADLTVNQSMNKWSNKGYGAEVSPSLNPDQKVSSLSDTQLNQLVSDMAKRESGASVNATVDPAVSAWVDQIANGNSTLTNVPAALRSKVAIALDNTPTTTYSPLASSRFTTAANRIEKNFIDLPQYQLTANGLPYLQRIDAAMQNPGSVSDQDLLDSLTKLNTAGNAITDAQVRLITDGKSFADTANTFANKFKNGGVLSDSQRTQIQSIAKAIYANYAKGYQPVYDQVTKQLDDAGIPEPFWSIPDLNDLAAKGGLTASGGESSSGGTSASTLPSDVQATLKTNLTFSPDGKTAYLPRSVWSGLGSNMDAILAEAKNDGFTLLIK